MSDYYSKEGTEPRPEGTRQVPVVTPRHRRASVEAQGEAPAAQPRPQSPITGVPASGRSGGGAFSRVSGTVRAADPGIPAAEGAAPPARPRVVYGQRPQPGQVRRPVQAAGYEEIDRLQAARRAAGAPAPTGGEVRSAPPRTNPPKRRSRIPVILLILVLLLALVALGLILWRGWPPFGGSETTPVTLSLEGSPSGTAPWSVTFRVTSGAEAGEMRLEDPEENILGVYGRDEAVPGAGGAGLEWRVEYTFRDPFRGGVQAYIYGTDGVTFIGKSDPVAMDIASPESTPTPAPTATPVPTPAVSPESSQGLVPLSAEYTVITEGDVQAVGLFAPEGTEPLAQTADYSERGGESVWTLSYIYETPASGAYRICGRTGETWNLEAPIGEVWVNAETAEALPEAGAGAPGENAPAEAGDRSSAALVQEPQVTQAPPAQETPVPVPVEVVAAETFTPEPVTPEPTAEPTPEPTAEPPQETPAPARRLEVTADASADPGLIVNVKRYNGRERLTEYLRADRDLIDMPGPDGYLFRPTGIFTFRGSSFRQNAAFGTVQPLSGLRVLWTYELTDRVRDDGGTYYYGIGRNSQPVIVQWAYQIRGMSNMNEEKKATTALREVIIAGENGRIYFLDLADGQPTRTALNVGYPMRATPSLSARGLPFMTVGQYARKIPGTRRQIGMRCYNLLDLKQMYFFNGLDTDFRNTKRPYSTVGNFDTSALFDLNSGSIIFAGGNGMLYLAKVTGAGLSTTRSAFSVDDISYVVMATQARNENKARTAVQSSLAAYQGYVFYADRGGFLRCVDANTMTVQWAVATGDAVESAVALDLEEDESLALYTANTLQNRNPRSKKADIQIRRINAETGAEAWTLNINVAKPNRNAYIPGVYASPVIGQGQLSDCVYYTVSGLSAAGGDTVFGTSEAVPGALICIEKATGRIRWAHALSAYSYSSPVAVYDEEGNGWILQAASDGTVSLLEGRTGTLVQSLTLEGTIMGSPAVYNGTMVIGTQGRGTSYVYGIALE